MSERYVTTHCKHCGGGIEFPDDGIGAEIACPHCEQPIKLEVEKPKQDLSRVGLKFLRTFQSRYDLSEIGKLEHWQDDLGAHPKTIVEKFLQSGLLEKAAPNVQEFLS